MLKNRKRNVPRKIGIIQKDLTISTTQTLINCNLVLHMFQIAWSAGMNSIIARWATSDFLSSSTPWTNMAHAHSEGLETTYGHMSSTSQSASQETWRLQFNGFLRLGWTLAILLKWNRPFLGFSFIFSSSWVCPWPDGHSNASWDIVTTNHARPSEKVRFSKQISRRWQKSPMLSSVVLFHFRSKAHYRRLFVICIQLHSRDILTQEVFVLIANWSVKPSSPPSGPSCRCSRWMVIKDVFLILNFAFTNRDENKIVRTTIWYTDAGDEVLTRTYRWLHALEWLNGCTERREESWPSQMWVQVSAMHS